MAILSAVIPWIQGHDKGSSLVSLQKLKVHMFYDFSLEKMREVFAKQSPLNCLSAKMTKMKVFLHNVL